MYSDYQKPLYIQLKNNIKNKILSGEYEVGSYIPSERFMSEYYGIKDRVYIAVLDMPHIVELSSFDRKYEGIARFPAIKRDISMLAKKDILVGDIELLIAKKAGKLLESTELFDVYEGEQIGEDFRSLAFSLSFRANDRTLSDEEVGEVMEKIVEALSESGVELRK